MLLEQLSEHVDAVVYAGDPRPDLNQLASPIAVNQLASTYAVGTDHDMPARVRSRPGRSW